MTSDADAAQARVFCDALHQQLRHMTATLAKLELSGHGQTSRALASRRQASELRRDIDKARYLIDRLQRRFPDIRPGVNA